MSFMPIINLKIRMKMKVSDVFFSGNRFGYLFKKELMEDMKKNLMRCIVLFGIFPTPVIAVASAIAQHII